MITLIKYHGSTIHTSLQVGQLESVRLRTKQ